MVKANQIQNIEINVCINKCTVLEKLILIINGSCNWYIKYVTSK